jgi:hypothetical protein
MEIHQHEHYEKKQIVVKPPLVYLRTTVECLCGQVKSMVLKVLRHPKAPDHPHNTQ